MTDQSVDIVPLVALTVGVIACITDVRTRRIPNLLTFGPPLLAARVSWRDRWSPAVCRPRCSAGSWDGAVPAVLPLGGMGAGDVKLLAALGAWLGPGDTFWLAIYASMAGGVMAVVVALGAAI